MGSDIAIDLPVAKSRSSFAYSFLFLPKPKRDALKVVYAFCRTTDDIVDNQHEVSRNFRRLQEWRLELDNAIRGESPSPLLRQLLAIARTFNIPVGHFQDLIRGVEMDLVRNRYRTFAELQEYCFLVASTVGLMVLGIFGPRSGKTSAYAVNLGIALQLTNILRDVRVDARYGRIYLPQEDLERFGCREEDILAGTFTPEFRSLMQFETDRAEEFFSRARESLPREDRRAMFPARIMERVYYRTLRRIRDIDYNVLDHAVRISRGIQFLIALKYWVKERVFGF
ncbi:MAG TPA: presqualene diphosphate synthase HpnD [Bacteroidota bacterium]|nr:presqualene diphosphate synthase HpnD [Bacteroidota bacterium]